MFEERRGVTTGGTGGIQPPPALILLLQWGPVFSGKMYIINSAFSPITIVI